VREVQQEVAQRVALQRDVALQEVGALAQELESLQEALSSPARPAGVGPATPWEAASPPVICEPAAFSSPGFR
jgi:hypothetical protein